MPRLNWEGNEPRRRDRRLCNDQLLGPAPCGRSYGPYHRKDPNENRGGQARFARRNATCHICKNSVFCYQGPSGRRVYLDDLGPPWPEHACIVNARRLGGWRERALIHDPWQPITPHSEGEIEWIIEAHNRRWPLSKIHFGQRSVEEWSLFLVTDIVRSGDRTVAHGRYVASDEGKYHFSFYSECRFLEPGDLVTVKGMEISFFDKATMSAVTFKHGNRIHPPAQSLPEGRSGNVP